MQHAALAGMVVAALAALPAQAQILHRYLVKLDDSLEKLTVAACFDGPAPAMLVAHEAAALYLVDMRVRNAAPAKVTIQRHEARLTNVPENACVDYRVQLKPIRSGAQSGGPETRRVGRALLTAIGDWLWRPPTSEPTENLEVRFELPAGIAVSAPWTQAPENSGAYRVGGTPAEWPGVVAFGGFEPMVIELPGAVLNLAVLDGPPPAQRDMLSRWIERTARGVAMAYGRFPVPSLQVVIAPAARGRSPVPWAYVARGGGPAVHLFIDYGRNEREFVGDWSATHEMSHLFLPYVNVRDAWLFEGLPTYLQNVLMARSRVITPQEAWQRMIEGFDRASRVGTQFSVMQASERMGRNNLYLRAYWGGAAYMLAADVELRAHNGGPVSLDSALEGLARCCSNSNRRWSAAEVIEHLDAATGTRVFSDLAANLLSRDTFPDYEGLFRRLGIEVRDGQVVFFDSPGARFRDAIMAPR